MYTKRLQRHTLKERTSHSQRENRPVCVLFQIFFVPLPHENLKLQETKEDNSAVDKENRYYAYSTNGC